MGAVVGVQTLKVTRIIRPETRGHKMTSHQAHSVIGQLSGGEKVGVVLTFQLTPFFHSSISVT